MRFNFLARPGEPIDSPPAAAPDSGRRSRFWIIALTIVLGSEVLAVAAFQAPFQRFDRFAIFDSGGELAIQDLIRRGARPGVDFGYLYGLLPLFLSRLWYTLAGLTPGGYRAQVLVCMMISAWGLARFAVYRRVGPLGVVLIVAAVPDLMLVSYVGVVQVLEQTLLINALAEQARGRRATALALLTACTFVKPSLAFVEGLAVVIAIVVANRRSDRSAWAREFGPALFTWALLAMILSATFGPVPLAKTYLPLTGMAVYRLANFGFFGGIGRDFWLLPHAGLRDYFRYELGFWMLGTAVLAWHALVGLRRLARGDSCQDRARGSEIIVTCAAVHIAFVLFLFGHRETWLYSFPMLILGLAALAPIGRWNRSVLSVLVLLLLINDRSKAVEVLRRYKTESPSAATLNLWADPAERAEWSRALELTRGQKPVLLALCEGGALLIPGFEPPTVGYLTPGNALAGEVARKAAQLNTARMIISAEPPDWPGFVFWPEIARALSGCEIVMEGRLLRVYRRVKPPAAGPAPPSHTTTSSRQENFENSDRRRASAPQPDK
jgi:hypothetical protein